MDRAVETERRKEESEEEEEEKGEIDVIHDLPNPFLGGFSSATHFSCGLPTKDSLRSHTITSDAAVPVITILLFPLLIRFRSSQQKNKRVMRFDQDLMKV